MHNSAIMNNIINKLSQLKNKFMTNKHLRVGLPFLIAMGIAPTLMQSFVEIQYMFGKVGNVDTLHEELMKKHYKPKSRDEILRESYKEMIEDRKEFLDSWEPVRVNRSWEEQDDTFKHYVTIDDLTLKD